MAVAVGVSRREGKVSELYIYGIRFLTMCRKSKPYTSPPPPSVQKVTHMPVPE